MLTTAAKGIAEIITVSGYVNVDFEDVKTVMKDSGAAVMGSATTAGDERAIKAAQQSISSPLLNNTDILGAKKILLSITSGDKAELQMDELTDITNFIHEQAGDEAEVIFGHGVDPALDESINVTVIATGFRNNSSKIKFEEKRKVIDLESSKQIRLFEEELTKEDPVMTPSANQDTDNKSSGSGYYFERPGQEKTEKEEENSNKVVFKLNEDEVKETQDVNQDQYLEEEEKILEEKRKILLRQAKERSEKLSRVKNYHVSEDEYKEKWDVPAYLRKKIKLEDIPHSSEHEVSRYNLNDENQILGNNKFLHDNVD